VTLNEKLSKEISIGRSCIKWIWQCSKNIKLTRGLLCRRSHLSRLRAHICAEQNIVDDHEEEENMSRKNTPNWLKLYIDTSACFIESCLGTQIKILSKMPLKMNRMKEKPKLLHKIGIILALSVADRQVDLVFFSELA
jgi:hypothetical protein